MSEHRRHEVAPAEAARRRAGRAGEEDRSLDISQIAAARRARSNVVQHRGPAPAHGARVDPAGGEPQPCPTRVHGIGGRAGRGAEAAVAVLRTRQVADGAARRRGARAGRCRQRRDAHEADHDGCGGRRRRPAHVEPAPVARDRPDERRAEREAEDEVPDRVREVVRQRLPGDGDPRRHVRGGSERQLVGVHDRPEAEPRERARDRERPAAELATRNASERRSADADEAPGHHLPRRPRALGDEEVRDEGSDRARDESRRRA